MPSTELSDANAGGNGRGHGEVRAADAIGQASGRRGTGPGGGGRAGNAMDPGFHGETTPQPNALDPGSHGVRTALPNAMDPGSHGVRTHWIRGFMAFQMTRRIATVMLMVPVWPESGFRGRAARLLA